jgi:hypothetical protein
MRVPKTLSDYAVMSKRHSTATLPRHECRANELTGEGIADYANVRPEMQTRR